VGPKVEAEEQMKTAVSSSWLALPQMLSSDLFARATSQKLAAGDSLFEAGDDGNGCYRLEKGALKVILRSHHGEERILALLTPHAIVGDLSMIDGLPRSATVMAISDCELCFVSQRAFKECARQYPEIYKHLTTLLASRLRETDKTIAALAFLSWKGRVARALLELAEVLGNDTKAGETVIPEMISQRELAAMAGVARENVSRAFSEWRSRRIISVSDHSLQIHDRSALQREMEL
jgi:CRP/FNR family cyclic AMP-dependent transcriptional regulator